jgi:membrane protein implicated in regulation of membrane protease activity
MEWLLQNPLALWLVIAAVLLAFEVGTGSGWLLWPTGAAALTGLAASAFHLDMHIQLVVFALLTIVTALAGRRFFPRTSGVGGDINDTMTRLLGSQGVTAEEFHNGRGRVFVDGKEWSAKLDNGGTLAAGAPVVVVDVGGSRLTVRAR